MEAASKPEKVDVREDTYTYDMFLFNMGRDPEEIEEFSQWRDQLTDRDVYAFEGQHLGAQRSVVEVRRESGRELSLLNFSSYNYFGFGYHPDVIAAAKRALEVYGLGAASSPVISGTLELHAQLERAIVEYFGLPDRRVSLFSSGYAVNLGAIQAFMKPGGYVLLDKSAHVSLIDGARLSGAKLEFFDHNDVAQLEALLARRCDEWTRVLVCVEGVYSADGDRSPLAAIVAATKKHGAFLLLDEAHSVLVAGERGRGVAEEAGVLEDIDLYVMTFSKAFGGVGGAVLAKRELAQYINWYARCRMFSCALDPAVTGGLLAALTLAAGEEGHRRRQRLHDNARLFRELLAGRVDTGPSTSWIVPVMYGDDAITLRLNDHLQRRGLDASVMQFPAVPKNRGRIRMFVTSEHSEAQLREAADIIADAAREFGFLLPG
ncbi:MAG: aminotransferase class I/II-fold pyridoxal phosphate-dependent enzyme [Myxococcales bacterium]|nr:aminotransferase class I/II-fold pyridoxal phosphate-dependent enzyme [Myxococcales bacterium]